MILGQALGEPHYWGTFNGPAWSISVEFYGYLLFALAAHYGGRLRFVLFLVLFLAGAAMLLTGCNFNINISRFMAGLFSGACLAGLTASRENSLPAWTPVPAIALLIASVWFKDDSLASILGVVMSTTLVIGTLAMASRGTVHKLLNCRVCLEIGTLSYSIYMSHFLVIYVMIQLVNRLSEAPRKLVDGN